MNEGPNADAPEEEAPPDEQLAPQTFEIKFDFRDLELQAALLENVTLPENLSPQQTR